MCTKLNEQWCISALQRGSCWCITYSHAGNCEAVVLTQLLTAWLLQSKNLIAMSDSIWSECSKGSQEQGSCLHYSHCPAAATRLLQWCKLLLSICGNIYNLQVMDGEWCSYLSKWVDNDFWSEVFVNWQLFYRTLKPSNFDNPVFGAITKYLVNRCTSQDGLKRAYTWWAILLILMDIL